MMMALIVILVRFSFIDFLKDFIYLFLERGEGREKERERNINVASWAPCTGDLVRHVP